MLLNSHFPITSELFEVLSHVSIAVLWYWFWVLCWGTLNWGWGCVSGINNECICCLAFASVDLNSLSPLSSRVGRDLLVTFPVWVSLVLGFVRLFRCRYLHANAAVGAWIGQGCACIGQGCASPEAPPLMLVNNSQSTLKCAAGLMCSCHVISVCHFKTILWFEEVFWLKPLSRLVCRPK